MSEHLHSEYVEGCFRCDLSRDEVTARPTAAEVRERAVQVLAPRMRLPHDPGTLPDRAHRAYWDTIGDGAKRRLQAERAAREALAADVVDALAAAGLLATSEAETRAEGVRLRIEGRWLVEVVDDCTCGGSGVLSPAHQPGCGLLPQLDLSTLPGWTDTAARALDEAAVERGARAVMETRWRFRQQPSELNSAHQDHGYDYACAVCRPDLDDGAKRLARAVIAAALRAGEGGDQ